MGYTLCLNNHKFDYFWKMNNVAHVGMIGLYWLAVYSLLWERRKKNIFSTKINTLYNRHSTNCMDFIRQSFNSNRKRK